MPGFLRPWLHLDYFFFLILVHGVGKEEISPCLCWNKLIKYHCTNWHNSRPISQSHSHSKQLILLPGTMQVTDLVTSKWPLVSLNNWSPLFLGISVNLTTEIRCINIERLIESVCYTMTIFYKSRDEARRIFLKSNLLPYLACLSVYWVFTIYQRFTSSCRWRNLFPRAVGTLISHCKGYVFHPWLGN